MTEERKIYTLTQLTTSLENFMMKHFGSSSYWVVAEIAKINEKGGNRYLELADSENGSTSAIMSATLWRRTYAHISEKIGKDLPSILKPGNKVLFQIRIEYHKIFGLKLNIMMIDPSYSYGEIERKKQETIKRLKKEGLFALQQLIEIPLIAKRVAVVGSPDTSGFRDFVNTLINNDVYTNFKIKQFPASVQGDKASKEIISALLEADQYNADVVVLIRGGGSKMDLNVFNDYELSKTIAQLRLPVITGIGHENDEVVADLVARQRCITPTAAAKFLYIRIGTFSAELRNAFDAIKQQSISLLSGAKEEFHHLNRYLVHFSRELLFQHQYDLRESSRQLQYGFLDLIQDQRNQLNQQLKHASVQAINKLHLVKDTKLPDKLERIQMMSINLIDQKRLEVKGLDDLLRMLDPDRLLENGYTISTVDDTDLNKLTKDLIGKEMKTLTSSSLIHSKITKSENRE